jgi:hypothetical protein
MATIPDVVTALGNDIAPVKFVKKMCACFLLSSPKNYEFGILVHDIGFGAEEHMGTFLMEDKRYETFALGILAVASNRLTLGRADNAFKSKFRTMQYRARLELYLSDAESMPDEFQKAVAAAVAAYKVLPRKSVPPKKTKKTVKGKYPLKKTRVASMTGEVRATSLKRKGSGWCQGVLKQYDPTQKLPYVIEWDVDPKVYENVDEADMEILTHQYKECDKRRLLDIECVGMEIFFTRVPDPPAARGGRLVCATIMFYDETLEKYKILYRDGTDEWVTDVRIDEEILHSDEYTLEQKISPIQEPWHPFTERKIQSYGMYCARNVGPTPRIPPLPSLNILSTVVLTNLPSQETPVARTTHNNITSTTNVVVTASAQSTILPLGGPSDSTTSSLQLIPQNQLGADSKGRFCNCYSSNCQLIGQRHTQNMTGPDPTLIKANPPVGSGGQPQTSETLVEVTTDIRNSAMTESKSNVVVDSPPITPSASVRNNSKFETMMYICECLTTLFHLMYSLWKPALYYFHPNAMVRSQSLSLNDRRPQTM